jgi:D-sedoheptulose 7-phosphate isomerase
LFYFYVSFFLSLFLMLHQEKIKAIIAESIATKQRFLADAEALETLERMAKKMVAAFSAGGKVLFCGNGGSAGDAQHIAAELSGRFYRDREPLFAEALHVNSSYLTAVANDYSYEEVYARMTRAMGREGDILIGISTSGNSGNVVRALEDAQKIGMQTFGLTGQGGGKMHALCDEILCVPSSDTPRIQECHILIGHLLCELVEDSLF